MTGQILVGTDEFSRLVAGQLRAWLPAGRLAVWTEAAGGEPEVACGVGRVLVVSDATEAVYRRIDAAAAAGVHVVYVTDTPDFKLHRMEEHHLAEPGTPYTIIRKGLSSEALLPAVELALTCGELVCPADLRFVLASATDYAAAVAAILAGDGHTGRTHQLAGSISLTPLGIASVISRIAGRQVSLREIEPVEPSIYPLHPGNLPDQLRKGGATEQVAAAIDRLYRSIAYASLSVGHWWTTPGDTLAQLLGRSPLTLEEAWRAALPPPPPD